MMNFLIIDEIWFAILLIVQFSFFLFCATRQFTFSFHFPKLFAFIILFAPIISSILSISKIRVVSLDLNLGIFACSSLTLLAFTLWSLSEETVRQAKKRVFWKIPAVGLLGGLFSANISQWLGLSLIGFGLVMTFIILIGARSSHRPLFRSYVAFVILLVLATGVGYFTGLRVIVYVILITAGFFQYQVINFLLVKNYVRGHLKQGEMV